MSKWISLEEDIIEIDPDTCNGCGSCITICGGKVFVLQNEKAVVAHREDCLECGNCEVVCPTGALKFHVPRGGTGIVYQCG